MVFSSIEFIYFFMPPVLIGFLLLRWLRLETGILCWLVLASFAFYAWWSLAHLALLFSSIVFNYGIHLLLLRKRRRSVFIGGIAVNLALLAWFKYADFLIGNVNAAAGTDIGELGLVLPLAISFFTFQQISFLHDTWVGRNETSDFLRYVLFVAFFPQLIAGPIVLQRDTIPQFTLASFRSRLALNLMVGSTLFFIGLFKKIVIADGIAPLANAVFGLADSGQAVSTEAAWAGALAYTFQIYFDFSGYCDMALGLARLFGIRLPANFNSPYKALSITEFWRRWHITLSRFLRDYLYIPLGGSRVGSFRRHANLITTMLLGGLWHGAGWNFVIWGGLHGGFLVANHLWRGSSAGRLAAGFLPPLIHAVLAWTLTMTGVVMAWVFFRAETFDGAWTMLAAMAGMAGIGAGSWQTVVPDAGTFLWMLVLLGLFVTVLPNSLELTARYRPVIRTAVEIGRNAGAGFWAWRPTPAWGAALSIVGLVAIIQIYRLNDLTEFIYFNF